MIFCGLYGSPKFEVGLPFKFADLALPVGPPFVIVEATYDQGSLEDYRRRRENFLGLLSILAISAEFACLDDWCSDIQMQIHNNSVYLQVLFELFLFQAIFPGEFKDDFPTQLDSVDVSTLTSPTAFHRILGNLVDLVDRLPRQDTFLEDWFRCYNAALTPLTNLSYRTSGYNCICDRAEQTKLGSVDKTMLYVCSRMFLKVLNKNLDDNEYDQLEASNLALATVNLVWSARTILSKARWPVLIRRSIFWAGLIVYKGDDTLGTTHRFCS